MPTFARAIKLDSSASFALDMVPINMSMFMLADLRCRRCCKFVPQLKHQLHQCRRITSAAHFVAVWINAVQLGM